MGGDAQSKIAKYRKKNAENYQDEEWIDAGKSKKSKSEGKKGKSAHRSNRNILKEHSVQRAPNPKRTQDVVNKIQRRHTRLRRCQ